MAEEKSQDEARADRRERRPQTRPATKATVSVEEKAQPLVRQTTMTVNLPKSELNFQFDDDLRPIGRRKFTVKIFISLRISIGRRKFVVEILCRR